MCTQVRRERVCVQLQCIFSLLFFFFFFTLDSYRPHGLEKANDGRHCGRIVKALFYSIIHGNPLYEKYTCIDGTYHYYKTSTKLFLGVLKKKKKFDIIPTQPAPHHVCR